MPEANPTTTGLTKEEKKFLAKALWTALQKPTWLKDDMVTFGKAIFSKQTLKELDDKVFERIIPFLNVITEELGRLLKEEGQAQTAATAIAAVAPATPEKEEKKIEVSKEEDEQEDDR